MNFCGLLGVIGGCPGEGLKDILNDCRQGRQGVYSFCGSSFLVSQNEPIRYPACTDCGDKSLMLFGNFFLKGIPLDDFLASGGAFLKKILSGNAAEDIPRLFVNGAYMGVIKEGDKYIIFTDFFGLMPVYYCSLNGLLIISTSIKAMDSFIKPSLNISALNEYLSLGGLFSGQAIKTGVYSLPPASFLTVNKGAVSCVGNYASYPEDELIKKKQADVIDEAKAAFKEAIGRLHSSKLKYCLGLTGGADTRLIYFNWPDRHNLLTETAGAVDSSDALKAAELVRLYGNSNLYSPEDLKQDKLAEGFELYYKLCDNPLNVRQNLNFYNLQWKASRNADIRLYGAGELLAGENLYLSRSPLTMIKEMFLPAGYHAIENSNKKALIKNVLKNKYKNRLVSLLNKDLQAGFSMEEILGLFNPYLGRARYQETFVERFRSFVLAHANYSSFGEAIKKDFILASPYNDTELIKVLLKHHPGRRRLRRLQLGMIRKAGIACRLPLDTTHLSVYMPYYLHKLLRVPRFVLNIGFHKKVFLIQRGQPPLYRIDPYLKKENRKLRDFIKETVLGCGIFDKARADAYFRQLGDIERFNFFTHHRQLSNIYILFRLAYAVRGVC